MTRLNLTLTSGHHEFLIEALCAAGDRHKRRAEAQAVIIEMEHERSVRDSEAREERIIAALKMPTPANIPRETVSLKGSFDQTMNDTVVNVPVHSGQTHHAARQPSAVG